MKTIRSFVMSFILGTFLTAAALAQTQPPAKIALLDTDAFYAEKTGITKILAAYNQLNTEFKPLKDELIAMQSKYEALRKEYSTMQSKGSIEKLNAIKEEAEKLESILRRKQEDSKFRYEKREADLLAPIVNDITRSMDIFFKPKGFTLVLDAKKIQGLLWSLESTDMTGEFIAFYNAR